MPKKQATTTRIAPESAMAGRCYIGPSRLDESTEVTTCVLPFEEQKQLLSNKPLFRQKIKVAKKVPRQPPEAQDES